MDIVDIRIRSSKNFYLMAQDHILFHLHINEVILELKKF